MLDQILVKPVKKPKLPLLSASRLKLYMQCPIMYKYKYLQGGEEKPNMYAINGSALHKAIELLHKDKISPLVTYAEKMSKYRNSKIIAQDQYVRLYSEGIDILNSYDPTWYTPRIEKKKPVVEKWFNLKYPNDENPTCSIRGYMDFVELDSVIDFKSSKLKLSKKKVESDIQFIIYYWAFHRLYGYYPSRIVYHRLPDHKQIVATEFDVTELDRQIETFLNDPMDYEPLPCSSCPMWCGVRHVIS